MSDGVPLQVSQLWGDSVPEGKERVDNQHLYSVPKIAQMLS
jgi:hypothetical protein